MAPAPMFEAKVRSKVGNAKAGWLRVRFHCEKLNAEVG
jgi:hypothetical protein